MFLKVVHMHDLFGTRRTLKAPCFVRSADMSSEIKTSSIKLKAERGRTYPITYVMFPAFPSFLHLGCFLLFGLFDLRQRLVVVEVLKVSVEVVFRSEGFSTLSTNKGLQT